MLKVAAHWLHRRIASAPRFVARTYLAALSLACRWLGLPRAATIRIRNAVAAVDWPDLQLRPRRVTAGTSTSIRLYPHLGEFDGDVLFGRRLDYERAAFEWLEGSIAEYDLVIEIGANVGVYTVFLNALARRPGARLRRIAAFEPSARAFRRLLANLEANGATNVSAYNAAVDSTSGFRTFYEPRGHLTNGSFVETFSRQFSDEIEATQILAVAAGELHALFWPSCRGLIKIDVEGYEAAVLSALGPVLDRWRPDLLIEVLDGFEGPIEASLPGFYERFLLGPQGLAPALRLAPHPDHRDWLLRAA